MRRVRHCLLTASLFILAAAPVLGAAGCGVFGEPKADVANAQHYTGEGLNFDYPGNWKTSSETELVGDDLRMNMIYVESKRGNALVIVQQFGQSLEFDYDELVDEFVAGMRESMPGVVEIRELDGGARTTIHREIMGAEREGRKLRYAPEILGEAVEHTVEAFFVELDDQTLVLYTQVPDEDRAKASPGFDQILDSLALATD